MKSRFWYLLILVLGISLVLAGCGGTDKKPAEQAKAPTLTLRLGHTHAADAETSSIHITALKFAELLKAQGIEVKIFAASQLGGDKDMHEQMRLGSLDMDICGTATVADKYAKIGVLDLPYIWKDYDHVHKVVDGAAGKQLADGLLKETGLRVIAWPDSFGFRDVATATKEVKTLEDIKNLKLRTIGTPTYIGTFKALGAAPVAMGFGEVYTSIQTKVIDGWEHEPPTLYASKTYEICKYLAKTDHLYGVLIMIISEKTWEKLTDQQKQIITKAAQDAVAYERGLVPAKVAQMDKMLTDKGMKINTIDKAPFVEATKAFREQWVKENGVEDIYKQIISQ
jgi:tripartite ATP-independent transporter DctP family solute receptor